MGNDTWDDKDWHTRCCSGSVRGGPQKVERRYRVRYGAGDHLGLLCYHRQLSERYHDKRGKPGMATLPHPKRRQRRLQGGGSDHTERTHENYPEQVQGTRTRGDARSLPQNRKGGPDQRGPHRNRGGAWEGPLVGTGSTNGREYGHTSRNSHPRVLPGRDGEDDMGWLNQGSRRR